MGGSVGRRQRRAINRFIVKQNAKALKIAKDIEKRSGIMPINNPEIVKAFEQPKEPPVKEKRSGPRAVV